MSDSVYRAGNYAALVKLGLQLSFDSPEEAVHHAKNRKAVGQLAGAAGNVAGGIVGGTAGGALGSAAGAGGTVAGTIGGSVAGSVAGQRVGSGLATLGYDVAHDVPQKAKSQYRSSLAKMHAGGGFPTGIGKLPTGYPKQIQQIQQNA